MKLFRQCRVWSRCLLWVGDGSRRYSLHCPEHCDDDEVDASEERFSPSLSVLSAEPTAQPQGICGNDGDGNGDSDNGWAILMQAITIEMVMVMVMVIDRGLELPCAAMSSLQILQKVYSQLHFH